MDDLWTQYTLVSIKTNNSIEYLERMDMWKFKALSKKLNEYIELENKQNGGGESDPNNPNGMQNMGMGNINQMMSSSQNMMKNSTANFKSFK